MLKFFTQFFLFFSVTSCSSTAKINNLKNEDKYLYISSCNVLDANFSIVKVLGRGLLCLPLENGDWIEANQFKMTYWSVKDGIKWQINGIFHHQIKRFDDVSLIVFTADIKKFKIGTVKFDSVKRIEIKTGKVMQEFSVYKDVYLAKNTVHGPLSRGFRPMGLDRIFYNNVEFEHTHLNSINFDHSRIIINQAFGEPFALTREFQLSSVPVWNNKDPLTHDFQVLEDGSTLYFKNGSQGELDGSYQVLHYDKNHQLIFQFPKKKEDFQTNAYSGGVEKIGDNYLIGFPSGDNAIILLVTSQGQILKRAIIQTGIQDVHRIPWNNFLELNGAH